MLLIAARKATTPTVEMIKGSADFPAESAPAKGLLLWGADGWGFVPVESCWDGYPPLLAS